MIYFFYIGLALFVGGCAVAVAEKPLEANVVRLPQVRIVRISTTLDRDWQEAIVWAFDRWKEAVPGLRYSVVISNEAVPVLRNGVTSFVPAPFVAPLFGITHNGYVELAQPTILVPEGKRTTALHELGHLLFGFGESKDPTSVMFLPLTNDTLSAKDIADANIAFLKRDGATNTNND